MDLNSLIIIEEIARLGTFSAAARSLKIPNSNLSLKVKQLEAALGQPLFTRSTRQVVITEFGRHVLAESMPVLDAKTKIEALAESASAEPSGILRITAPYDFGLYMLRGPIPTFTHKYPKIRIELELSNSFVDLISGGFDLAIRAATKNLSDSSTIALKLGSTQLRLYTHKKSPHAKICTLRELKKAPFLSMTEEVNLRKSTKTVTFRPPSHIVVKDMTGIKHATLGMGGVGVMPEFICSDERSKAELVNIFPEWSAGKGIFYALYPQGAALTPKNRAFIEFLKENSFAGLD